MAAVMSIHEAMAFIANVQVALVQHGVSIGEKGPCGYGVDGRYGPETRAGFQAFAQSVGIAFDGQLPSDELLAALQLGVPVTAAQFTEAVKLWNQLRAKTPNYAVAADKVLCEAIGICAGTQCPPFTLAPPSGPSPDETQLAAGGGTGDGPPKWGWAVLAAGGVAVLGFLGYQAYKWHADKKRKSGGSMAPGFAAWQGTEVRSQELGEDEEEDEGEDGGGYDGYGNPEAGDDGGG